MSNNNQADIKLVIMHVMVLLAGLVAGVAASYGISLVPFSFGGDVEAARRLGIVSLTVLEGYSKTRDIVNYLTLTTLPPCFAMLFWYVWVRGGKYDQLCRIFGRTDHPGNAIARWQMYLVLAAILVLSYNTNYFFKPIAGWTFLGEEGINLFAVSSILSGGVYSLDFSNGYGPMLIYPLALLMKLIGTTILTDRIYTYLLNLAAYGIVTFFFYRTCRSRAVFVLSSLLYFSMFHPFAAVSPNTTYLRVALGLLPLLLAARYLESGSRHFLWLCGLVAGQCILFSQEVAICTLMAILMTLFAGNLKHKTLGRFPGELFHLGVACLISVSPMMLYFAYKGALTSFLYELAYYPKLYTMGYSALKFPTLATLFTEPIAGQALFPYWLISIYLLAAIWLLLQLALGQPWSRNFMPIAVLLMGVFLFRSALCRSDFYHLFFTAQPAMVLFFLMLDRAVCRTSAGYSRIIAVSIFAFFYLIPYLSPGYRNHVLWNFAKKGLDVRSKWTRQDEGYQLLVTRTGGVLVGEELAGSVAKIRNFLVRNTTPEEYVYFYPNEAGYYFLLDRKNPTRYAFSYQAVTSEQRREIVRDLEAKKPRYIVYSRRVWLIDNIKPEIQVPELSRYLSDHYLPSEDLDEILIMKRIGI